MRVHSADFRKLELRCHALLRDVPLHDVWAIPLPGGGPGRTMQDVRRRASYLHRLTEADRAQSHVPAGTRDGPFRVLYVLPHEALSEIRNATVHGFLASSLVHRGEGYVLYLAVYVKAVSRFTPLYMTLIDPFRRFVIYPGIVRTVQQAWLGAYPTTTS